MFGVAGRKTHLKRKLCTSLSASKIIWVLSAFISAWKMKLNLGPKPKHKIVLQKLDFYDKKRPTV